MRNANVPKPVASGSNVPAVKATTGLGAGGGAGVYAPEQNSGFGAVLVYPGKNPATSGSVTLTFPQTPPTLFVSGSENFGTVSQSTVGNDVTFSWASANLTTGSPHYRLSYEWAVSK